MHHHVFEGASQALGDDEVCMLSVVFELGIDIFQSFGAPIAHLGGCLHEVVFEDAIAAFSRFDSQ